MPKDLEDPEGDVAAAGLPTRLPSLPVFAPIAISHNIDRALSALPPDTQAVQLDVEYTNKQGEKDLTAILAVKLGDGWSAYVGGSTDFEHDHGASFGVRKVFGRG